MAVSTYFNTVQKLYIAYYQRPADPAGLLYWAQRLDAAGGSLVGIINAFATSAESQALYGTINANTIDAFIGSVYQALFNRAPDAAGKAFYKNGFLNGTFTAGNIALDILNGAQGDDAVAIQNKVTVANRFTEAVDGRSMSNPDFGTGTAFAATYAGNADAQVARNWLKNVTSDPATVKSASQVAADVQANIADAGDPIKGATTGQTFMLTTGSDTGAAFTGGAGNDTFIGNQVAAGVTWTVGDAIDGGGGTDTFTVTQTGAITIPTGATVKNIENAEFLSGSTVTLNTTTWTGLQQLKSNATGGTTLTAAADVNITATENSVSAVDGNVTINGGKDIALTVTGTTDDDEALNTTTYAGAEIVVGGTTEPTGAVTYQ